MKNYAGNNEHYYAKGLEPVPDSLDKWVKQYLFFRQMDGFPAPSNEPESPVRQRKPHRSYYSEYDNEVQCRNAISSDNIVVLLDSVCVNKAGLLDVRREPRDFLFLG